MLRRRMITKTKMEILKNKTIHTDSEIEINRIYKEPIPLKEDAGEFPFTRGIQTDMYRGKQWTMRQYAGFSTAEESNERYHHFLN